jgi:hypothetical protein
MTTTTASVTSGSLAKVAAEIEAWDATRPRSLQTAIGASGLYGCRAEHTLRLNEVPESDPHLSWAALVGTAIHGVAEAAAPASVLTEQRFTYRGVTATIDRYDAPVLVDLKTKEDAAAIAKVRKTGPRREQIAQVMLGAAALQEAGYVVEQVELLFLPRVGSLEDGWSWTAVPDRAIADEAAEWAATVTADAAARAGLSPAEQVEGLQDSDWSFCAAYCPFVTTCRGTSATPVELDALVIATAEEYLAADEAEKQAAATKKSARKFLEPYADLKAAGLRWQGGGTRYEPTEELDLDQVLADYKALIGEPPVRRFDREVTSARSLRRAT